MRVCHDIAPLGIGTKPCTPLHGSTNLRACCGVATLEIGCVLAVTGGLTGRADAVLAVADGLTRSTSLCGGPDVGTLEIRCVLATTGGLSGRALAVLAGP